MARRYTGKMNGEQFSGNSHSEEVHDLDREDPRCQIDEILKAGHEVPFRTLAAAEAAGYDHGDGCLGAGSKR